MLHSRLLRATRALVSELLSLAKAYKVVVDANHDSEAKEALKAYRRVALKVHPDKGGNTSKFQKLQARKEEWGAARKPSAAPGNPNLAVVAKRSKTKEQGGRVRGVAVLLTYAGKWSLSVCRSFVAFVRRHLKAWSVWRWCATLEKSEAKKLHVHSEAFTLV